MRAALDLMMRRGPDDEGIWSDGTRCTLGFRRLSILDLSPSGHQPMTTREGRHVLVFNGEIYNFRELRRELAGYGDQPRSSGDAEVLLLALRRWGSGALAKLDGMFALAFYDIDAKELLLARDHAGIKPLYVGTDKRGVVFGSRYDQVLRHPWLRATTPDEAMVASYLRLGFLAGNRGLHRGIGQLSAGEWRRYDQDGFETSGRFFEVSRYREPTLRGAEAIEALDAAISLSVERHLISDVPVGVLLSGGVDSPLVAAEAMRKANGTLKAFTIAVDDPEMDESDDARRFAEEIGVEHIVERIAANEAVALVDDVVSACSEPTADYSVFPTLLVSRLARRHVKVVLSGDGGDELYWGYPSRFASAIEQARYFAWPRVARWAAIGVRKVSKANGPTRDVLDYSTIGRLYQRKHTLLAEDDLRALFPTLPDETLDEFVFAGTDRDTVAQWVRWNELTIHLDRVLAKVDRASMFHSLEVRVPLLAKNVIETALRTDWRTCLDVRTRVGKLPLRQVLSRRLRHQRRDKKGFTIPISTWLAGPLRDLVHDSLEGRKEMLGVPLDRGALTRLLRQSDEGDRTKAWGVWLLLSLSLWDQRVSRMTS
ncbi:MAG: asparagine synthase (glutamine-hydrolyzing) [Kofleriaceae bacterium]